jgi:hypothetical protein
MRCANSISYVSHLPRQLGPTRIVEGCTVMHPLVVHLWDTSSSSILGSDYLTS